MNAQISGSPNFLLLLMALLSGKEVRLLERTNQLLEEVLETLDIMSDKETMKKIAESRREAKAGKTNPFMSLLEELDIESKIRAKIHFQV